MIQRVSQGNWVSHYTRQNKRFALSQSSCLYCLRLEFRYELHYLACKFSLLRILFLFILFYSWQKNDSFILLSFNVLFLYMYTWQNDQIDSSIIQSLWGQTCFHFIVNTFKKIKTTFLTYISEINVSFFSFTCFKFHPASSTVQLSFLSKEIIVLYCVKILHFVHSWDRHWLLILCPMNYAYLLLMFLYYIHYSVYII